MLTHYSSYSVAFDIDAEVRCVVPQLKNNCDTFFVSETAGIRSAKMHRSMFYELIAVLVPVYILKVVACFQYSSDIDGFSKSNNLHKGVTQVT